MMKLQQTIPFILLSTLSIGMGGCAVDDVLDELATPNSGYITVSTDTKSIEISVAVSNIGTYSGSEYYGVSYDLLSDTNESIINRAYGSLGNMKTICTFTAMSGGNINEYICNTTMDLDNKDSTPPTDTPQTIYLEVGKSYRTIMTELIQYGAHEDDITELGSFVVQ